MNKTNPTNSADEPATPPKQQAVESKQGIAESTESLIESYHAVAEWIRFADAKAAVVLTVGAALAGLLIPTIEKVVAHAEPAGHLLPYWKPIAIILFCVFLFFLVYSATTAFLCITPFRKKGRHPSLDHCAHFHPAAIAHRYKIDEVDEFTKGFFTGGDETFRKEVVAALLFDSHISNAKYQRVARSIRLFAASAVFAFLYLLVLQF